MTDPTYYPIFTDEEVQALRDGVVLASVQHQCQVLLTPATERRQDDPETVAHVVATARVRKLKKRA